MKRLLRKSEVNFNIKDLVQWKKHPYDTSIYIIEDILPDGTLFINNGEIAHTNIKPSVVKPAK